MAELFPPPQDHGTGRAERIVRPRRDPVARDEREKPGLLMRTPFPHQWAERTIAFVSRWAGPAALLTTVALLGWWLFG